MSTGFLCRRPRRDLCGIQSAQEGPQRVILLAQREGYPEIENQHLEKDGPNAEPIRTEADAYGRDAPRRLTDRVVAGVKIKIDPTPKPSQIVSHIQGDDGLVGLEQMLLDQRVRFRRAMRDHVLPLE